MATRTSSSVSADRGVDSRTRTARSPASRPRCSTRCAAHPPEVVRICPGIASPSSQGQLAAGRGVAVVRVQRTAASLTAGTSARSMSRGRARDTPGTGPARHTPASDAGRPSAAAPVVAARTAQASAEASAARSSQRHPQEQQPSAVRVDPATGDRATVPATRRTAPRRAHRFASPAAEAEAGLLAQRRVVRLQPTVLKRPHQRDPAARAGPLVLGERVGRAGRQAEAARDAGVQSGLVENVALMSSPRLRGCAVTASLAPRGCALMSRAFRGSGCRPGRRLSSAAAAVPSGRRRAAAPATAVSPLRRRARR